MGIKGLLPALSDITEAVHVSLFRGTTVAVDAYAWLHRGVYGCSLELCMGEPTEKYVDWCVQRVAMLQSYGVTPLLVFDGSRMPLKASTEQGRRATRSHALAQGRAHLAEGRREVATRYFQRAAEVTPDMARKLQRRLRSMDPPVDTIVAPYEADAQLAFLARAGLVTAVVSEGIYAATIVWVIACWLSCACRLYCCVSLG